MSCNIDVADFAFPLNAGTTASTDAGNGADAAANGADGAGHDGMM